MLINYLLYDCADKNIKEIINDGTDKRDNIGIFAFNFPDPGCIRGGIKRQSCLGHLKMLWVALVVGSDHVCTSNISVATVLQHANIGNL